MIVKLEPKKIHVIRVFSDLKIGQTFLFLNHNNLPCDAGLPCIKMYSDVYLSIKTGELVYDTEAHARITPVVITKIEGAYEA